MIDKRFSYVSGDYEIRWESSKSNSPELIKWQDCYDSSSENSRRSCYTIAYWKMDTDGMWDIIILPNRMFNEFIDGIPEDIWKAMKGLNDLLNSHYRDY